MQLSHADGGFLLPRTDMRTTFLALQILAVGCLASCMPHARAYVGASFMRVEGDMALQNAGGTLNLGQDVNTIEDLGAEETSGSAYLRAEADWGPHRARVSGFGATPSGEGTLADSFGDLSAGAPVRSQLDYENFTAAYTFDVIPTSLVRLGLGVEVGIHRFDLLVDQTNSNAFEELEADFWTPMPCIDAEVDLGAVSFCLNVGAFDVDLGDADGNYHDAEAFVRWAPLLGFELIGGWRNMLLDTNGEADNRDFRTDVEVSGWFLGGGISF
jgi:hypothetical protein